MVKFFDIKTTVIYILIIIIFLSIPLAGNQAICTLAQGRGVPKTIVIDAGHGGVDGGAVSCTGVYESHINLEIAKKLEDLMHLLGIHTIMIRSTDRSVYTEGKTIAAKKVSDIKERLRIINTTPNALLLSLHQNNFHDSRYCGAQVFYNQNPGSKELAERIQTSFRESLNPSNKRQVKKASGIYLMDHINCTGVLVECGFLSHPEEEAMLRNNAYQNKLCCILATEVCKYLNT